MRADAWQHTTSRKLFSKFDRWHDLYVRPRKTQELAQVSESFSIRDMPIGTLFDKVDFRAISLSYDSWPPWGKAKTKQENDKEQQKGCVEKCNLRLDRYR